jgi:hypothetical protein
MDKVIDYDALMLQYPTYKPPRILVELGGLPRVESRQVCKNARLDTCTQEDYIKLFPFILELADQWVGGFSGLGNIIFDKEFVKGTREVVGRKYLQIKAMMELGKGPEFLPTRAMLQGCDPYKYSIDNYGWDFEQLCLLNYLAKNVKTVNMGNKWRIVSFFVGSKSKSICWFTHRLLVKQGMVPEIPELPRWPSYSFRKLWKSSRYEGEYLVPWKTHHTVSGLINPLLSKLYSNN